MKESALASKMAKRVRDRGGWCRKFPSGPHGSGFPDLIGCYQGVMLGLEVKLPKTRHTVTELQRQTLKDMREGGAVAVMVSSVKEVDAILDRIDGSDGGSALDFGLATPRNLREGARRKVWAREGVDEETINSLMYVEPYR